MKTLVISDVHANLTALQAVLAAAGEFDRVWCLGDRVGYGPDANDCIRLIQSLPNLTCAMGNHDAAMMGFIDLNAFNHEAREAIRTQADTLSQESLDFLELLNVRSEEGDITFVHGSPGNPIWEYMMGVNSARANFREYTTRICLFGHSHVPTLFVEEPENRITLLVPGHGDMWRSEKRFMLNPGSVGQPRDHDPRASFVLYDDETDIWQFKRVKYDIAAVQERFRALDLSPWLARRLSQGV